MLACDLVVASETAEFGLPEVRRGLVAGAGGLLRLPRRIPYHIAMEIALTGEHYPAQRLAEAGLVNGVVPAGEALAGAIELGRDRGRGAPLALAATKRVIVESGDWDSRRDVRAPGRDHQAGVHLQGRDGGRDGLRREATAGLARRVNNGRNC